MAKKCTNKKIGEWIGLYEVGAIQENERRVFFDHLIECEHCYDEVYSIEPITLAFRNHRASLRRAERAASSPVPAVSVPTRFRSWALRPAFAIAALILVLVLGSFLVLRQERTPATDIADSSSNSSASVADSQSQWANLQIAKAKYTRPEEGVTLRDGGDAFGRAMAAYEQDDFSSAIEQLETLGEMQPRNAGEVSFYLGVSLLLVNRSEDAILPLKQSLQVSSGQLAGRSHYYLAQAYLKKNQPQQATAELDNTIRVGGEYEAAARALRKEILIHTRQTE